MLVIDHDHIPKPYCTIQKLAAMMSRIWEILLIAQSTGQPEHSPTATLTATCRAENWHLSRCPCIAFQATIHSRGWTVRPVGNIPSPARNRGFHGHASLRLAGSRRLQVWSLWPNGFGRFKLQDPMLPNIIAKRIQFFCAGRKRQNCYKSLDTNLLRNRYEGLPKSSFKLVNARIEYHRLSDRRLGSFGCIKAFGELNPSQKVTVPFLFHGDGHCSAGC